MESQAEDSERGTEGELKCLGRASEGPWQCLWSWLDHGSERFPGWNCGNPGCDRGILGGLNGIQGGTGGILWGLNGIQGGTGVFLAEKFESPTRCIESLAPPIGPRPVEPVQKPIGKDGLPCPNLYICNQGRNQSW